MSAGMKSLCLRGGLRTLLASLVMLGGPQGGLAALPPVPVPPENPITEPKRVLGKILFWDEQLSPSQAMACGTCHLPGRAGSDGRRARHPGADGVLNTPDDVFGSPGVIRSDAENDFERDPVFLLAPQATNRAANSMINAAYSTHLFWDGRARSTYVNPETNQVVIGSGGALESQASGPPVSTVEMAHAALTWPDINERLGRMKPMDLASNPPADVAAVLAGKPSYPDLFRSAFGDPQITAQRVAFAIATYQRTLISDQSPWDRFMAGDTTALTPQQQQGWASFQARSCNACHTAPLFTDNTFRNIGLRPIAEDTGLQSVTGLLGDRGRFKVPGLRNVGLKNNFMHTGQFTTLQQVMGFYARPSPNTVNRDPLIAQINLPPNIAQQIQDFLANGLTDPRVAAETAPFDRPVLYTERIEDRPLLLGGGRPGTGGVTPRIIAQTPPMIGNLEFRLGLDLARSDASAAVALSTIPPVNGVIVPQRLLPAVATGSGANAGVATAHWALTADQAQPGQTLYAQWIVTDPGAVGGQALSTVAQLTFFCGLNGCASPCSAADIVSIGGFAPGDGAITVDDYTSFINAFAGDEPLADIVSIGGFPPADGAVTVDDYTSFINAFAEGCV